MTIEEKIQKKAEGYGKLAPAFLEGAKFALENQWISVKNDLPYNHKELLDGERETKLVLTVDACGGADIDFMSIYKGTWQWWNNSNVTYWLSIPDFDENLL